LWPLVAQKGEDQPCIACTALYSRWRSGGRDRRPTGGSNWRNCGVC